MSRAAPAQTNFNGGEFSPLLLGRSDLARYVTGCQVLRNMIPTVQGPAKRRGGTMFVAEVKDSTARCWLGRFKFSKSQSYIFEIGPFYIRFFADRGQLAISGTPVEVVTPYAASDLITSDGTFALDMEQSGDVVYIACPTRPPQKLVRSGATDWALTPYVTKNGPLLDQNPDKTLRVYASARTGTTVTVTASANFFTNQHVGAFLRLDLEDFLLPPWEPQKSIPVDALYRSDGKTYQAKNADGTRVTGTKTPIHEEGTVLDGSGMTTEDTPRAIGIEWEFRDPGYGLARIVSVPNALTAIVAVETDSPFPDGVVGSGNPTNVWQIGAWGPHNEYPAYVCFWKSRLCWFGRRQFWMSVPDDYDNYARDIVGQVRTDSAITRTLQTTQTIRWVAPLKNLLIGTEEAEWLVGKQTDSEPLGPNNLNADKLSSFGSRAVQPIEAGKGVLFVHTEGLRVREAHVEDGAYSAPDVTVAAEHITASGIINWTWQQAPDQVLWSALANGGLIGTTVERDQEVGGWHRHPTDGLVESVCTIPSPDGSRDDLWLLVQRTVNGTTRRYMEYMSVGDTPNGDQADCFYVDCGLSYSGAPATLIGGLGHLVGREVQILADGAVHPPRTVALDGTVTLRAPASKVQAGLALRAVVAPMPLEAGAQLGSAQGKTKRIDRVGLRFYRTLGCQVGPNENTLTELPFRTGADPLGQAPSLFTGIRHIDFDGDYEQDATVFIVQDQPLPLTLCAVLPELVTHERS